MTDRSVLDLPTRKEIDVTLDSLEQLSCMVAPIEADLLRLLLEEVEDARMSAAIKKCANGIRDFRAGLKEMGEMGEIMRQAIAEDGPLPP